MRSPPLLLALLTLTVWERYQGDASVHDVRCVNDSQPVSEEYWTPWFSSSNSLNKNGEKEDFTEVCESRLRDTECRFMYTQLGFNETGIFYNVSCIDGILVCKNSTQEPGKQCMDIEMRLRCAREAEAPPEPEFHWSLSEVDTNMHPYSYCNNKAFPVYRVEPIRGNLVGNVNSGGLLTRYGPYDLGNLCAVVTNRTASILFQPFVYGCLSKQACCNNSGTTLMFWLRSDNDEVDFTATQTTPLHIFQSPLLRVTFTNGTLVSSYRGANAMRSVRTFIPNREWAHISILINATSALQVYENGWLTELETCESPNWAFPDIDDFEDDNATFKIFVAEEAFSDIVPLVITDLKIFYTALEQEIVQEILDNDKRDAPPSVISFWDASYMFRDNITQDVIRHIYLSCLVEDNLGNASVRFLYSDDNIQYHPVLEDRFLFREYYGSSGDSWHKAVLQILSMRNDDTVLPEYFTCEIVSARPLSSYAANVRKVTWFTDLDSNSFYWTKWFGRNGSGGGTAAETLLEHKKMAAMDDSFNLCKSPFYAECRAKKIDQTQWETVQWYQLEQKISPVYPAICNSAGIRCSSESSHCPDLMVRYACRVKNSAAHNPIAQTSDKREDNQGVTAASNINHSPGDNDNITTDNAGTNTIDDSTFNTSSSPRDSANISSTVTDVSHQVPASGGRRKSPSIQTTSFTTSIKNLNFLYPVGIVVFGVGIPTIVACYFLWRRPTDGELEEQQRKLIAASRAGDNSKGGP